MKCDLCGENYKVRLHLGGNYLGVCVCANCDEELISGFMHGYESAEQATITLEQVALVIQREKKES